jgi:hypothetical protein
MREIIDTVALVRLDGRQYRTAFCGLAIWENVSVDRDVGNVRPTGYACTGEPIMKPVSLSNSLAFHGLARTSP